MCASSGLSLHRAHEDLSVITLPCWVTQNKTFQLLLLHLHNSFGKVIYISVFILQINYTHTLHSSTLTILPKFNVRHLANQRKDSLYNIRSSLGNASAVNNFGWATCRVHIPPRTQDNLSVIIMPCSLTTSKTFLLLLHLYNLCSKVIYISVFIQLQIKYTHSLRNSAFGIFTKFNIS